MEQEVFLEKNRSVMSVNTENVIDISLERNNSIIGSDSVSVDISLLDKYLEERDNCNKYRIILNVNPVCSNVLFNMKSEIIINEGSYSCEQICDTTSGISKSIYASSAMNTTSAITYLQVIRDSEYSNINLGNFTYHCGADIFNNPMLRKNGFVHVNKMNDSSLQECGNVYNTISDYLRDENGDIVKKHMGVSIRNSNSVILAHTFSIDSVDSMKNSFSERCKERDGWFGFYNPGNINIKNSDSNYININSMLSNKKQCEFIDLYPDRTLFSFFPKWNAVKKRKEKNWEYFITYPYLSDFEMFNTVSDNNNNCMKCDCARGSNSSSVKILRCTSYFKHNLSAGDFISVYYYTSGRTSFQKLNKQIRVESVGDANGEKSDKCFSVRFFDIRPIIQFLESDGFYFKKISGNEECLYYFRKFKKIKNKEGQELNSELGKLAFSRNIYGDKLSQIIFTDDIDVSGLLDENGRDVKDLYFTVLKTNYGHSDWYGRNNFSSDSVEYSHCFGKLTSGIDFEGVDSEPFDYNIHYLHNLDKHTTEFNNNPSVRNTFSAWGDTLLVHEMPKVIEDDITGEFDDFYGDIVEFDKNQYKTTVIGNVYHRFNTAQRECFNIIYRDIYNDTIIIDDYDVANRQDKSVFSVSTYYVNNFKHSNSTYVDGKEMIYGNIMPEGYFYNPHNIINIKEESDVYYADALPINYSKVEITPVTAATNVIYSAITSSVTPSVRSGTSIVNLSYYIKINIPINYGFINGDVVAIYDKKTDKIVWGVIHSVEGNNMVISVKSEFLNSLYIASNVNYFVPNSLTRRFYMFWSKESVPLHSKLLFLKRKFSWRNVVKMSSIGSDSELYNMPFSNGRHYINKNINFFVRRQDPTGKYGLGLPLSKVTDPIANPMISYSVTGYEHINVDTVTDVVNNLINTCY